MNNYYYKNYDLYPSMTRKTNFMPINNSTKSIDLFNPKEGFRKGNLFSNLYDEYKNYQPENLKAKTEQEQQLLEIQTLAFATHDLNLYLDLNPNDQSMIELFNDYRRKLIELINEYEKKYGPMTINSKNNDFSGYTWENTPWPWEGYNV